MSNPFPAIVSWPQQPMVRVLLLFFAGILLGEFQLLLPVAIQISLCWALIILLLFRLNLKKPGQTTRLFSGIFISITVICCGNLCHSLRDPSLWTNNLSSLKSGESGTFLIRVLPEPVAKINTIKFNAEVLGIREGHRFRKIVGSVRVLIREPGSMLIKTGEEWWLYGRAALPDGEFLPGTFSMRKWMAGEGISHVLTIKSSQLKKSGKQADWIRSKAIDWRKALIRKLARNGLKGNQLAVAAALILGERSEIEREVLIDYTNSGIVHILAVSGLHVGLIYAGLLLFLGRIKSLKNTWTAAVICLLALWLYAMMTGLSPSVLRAAVMYSFIAVSAVRKVSLSPFNALAASAFILLAFNPWIWKNAGFQLSYSAVWGILSFQNLLSNLVFVKFRLFRYLVQSIAVSVSAQLSTSPITLYIFGCFPVYFLLANLVAIPVSTLLTYTGIAAIIFADIPWLGVFLAHCLGLGIRLLNGIAENVSALPNASATNLFISLSGMLLSSSLLLMLSLILQHYNVRRLLLFLFLLFTFSLLNFKESWEASKKQALILFSKSGNLHLLHVGDQRARHFVFGENEVSEQIENDIKLYLRKWCGIGNCTGRYRFFANEMPDEVHFFWFEGRLIILVDSHFRNRSYNGPKDAILIIARRLNAADSRLLQQMEPRLLIIAPSLRKTEQDAWEKLAADQEWPSIAAPIKVSFYLDPS